MKPRILIPGGRPKLIKQLQTGSPTASTDCGPSTVLVGLEHTSRNELRPGTWATRDWIHSIRQPMTHSSAWPATTLQNHEQAVESRGIRRRFHNRRWPRPRIVLATLSFSDVATALKNGHFVGVAVDYGRVNNLMPRLSGSETYDGGHMIGLIGIDRFSRSTWTLLYDPLFDGRRPGIPLGPQTVRLYRYLRAGETWGVPPAGKGHVKGWIIR